MQKDAILVTGAYGREANLVDWESGLDFKVVYGPYFSIRDIALIAENHSAIEFYNWELKQVLFTVQLA
jgi:hypothetical protein